jgi:hypothetical protein
VKNNKPYLRKEPTNPWTPQDEGDHYPVAKEWWTTELFFTTKEDHRTWNLITTFAYELETPSCFHQYVLFDLQAKKPILHKDVNDDINKFTHLKNTVDIKYEKSWFQGLYPHYHLHHQDEKQGFIADIDMDAQALPHWIAQEITGGKLPIGLNTFRYGFLPNCALTGTIVLNDKEYTLDGKGYVEHAWGNWSYRNPLQFLGGARETLGTYLRLSHWWLSRNKLHIPSRIGFSLENDMFGYDWLWGVCENNWSFFFGNFLLWISEGPSVGTLYLTADGKQYLEFTDVHFKYNKVKYIHEYDTFYPSDMEVIGVLDEKKIHLRFTSTTEGYEYIDPNKKRKFYKAFILCELPGRVDGTYTDGKQTVSLHGFCKSVPQRQAPSLGHHELALSFLTPPKGLGVSIEMESHRLKRKCTGTIQLAPSLKWHISFPRIELSKIPRESEIRRDE